jgi:hypothetical protein
MRRQIYLESKNAEKDGTRYKFDFRSRKEREFKSFQLRDAVVVHANSDSSAIDNTTIAALTPYCWLRWADKVKITPASIEVNDDIGSIVSSGEAGITFTASSGNLKYNKIGQSYCVLSATNWHGLNGSSGPTQNKAESTLFMIFETPASLHGRILWKDAVHRIWTGSVLKVEGVHASGAISSSCALHPNTPYILQLVWDNATGTQAIRLINLNDNTEQTDTVTIPGWTTGTITETGHAVTISNAMTGFMQYKVGETLVFNHVDVSIRPTVITYLKALFSGTSGSVIKAADPVHCITMHSEFLNDTRFGKSVGKDSAMQILQWISAFNSKGLYVKDRSAKYDCDQDLLDIIDIFFTKPDGSEIECDFTVCLDLFDDVSQL